MYPSDFNAADTVYAPAEDGLVLGVPPLLAILVLVLVAALAIGAYRLGRTRGGSATANDADAVVEDVYKAVLIASRAAMAASSNDLRTRTQALRDAITTYLEPVLVIGRRAEPSVKALDEALKAETDETPKPEDKPRIPVAAPEPAVAASAFPPVTVNQFLIGPRPAPPPPAPPPEPAPPKAEAKPRKRPMTGPEAIEAQSRAVRAFHDHWSDGAARIAELKAARAALSRRPPPATLKG